MKTVAEFRGSDTLKLELDLLDGTLTLEADILKLLDVF